MDTTAATQASQKKTSKYQSAIIARAFVHQLILAHKALLYSYSNFHWAGAVCRYYFQSEEALVETLLSEYPTSITMKIISDPDAITLLKGYEKNYQNTEDAHSSIHYIGVKNNRAVVFRGDQYANIGGKIVNLKCETIGEQMLALGWTKLDYLVKKTYRDGRLHGNNTYVSSLEIWITNTDMPKEYVVHQLHTALEAIIREL